MTAAGYRAQFDAVVTFANGGGPRAEAFREDVPGPDAAGSAVRLYLDAPYLTEACARWLAMVPGSLAPSRSTSMTSAMGDGQHSILLGVGMPVVEHLTPRGGAIVASGLVVAPDASIPMARARER